jgi:hypothetical protein
MFLTTVTPSNVAAPTLCFTLIRVCTRRHCVAYSTHTLLQPILRTLPNKSSFGRCLIVSHFLCCRSMFSLNARLACYSPGSKHWRAEFAHIIASKSHCHWGHGSAHRLVYVVHRGPSGFCHFDSTHLGASVVVVPTQSDAGR